MERVDGIKKTVLITEYIACPRCGTSLFEAKNRTQEKVCSKCNIIVTKPGVRRREKPPVEEKITAEVKELEVQLGEDSKELILTDQPRVVNANDEIIEAFNKLEEVSQNIIIGEIKQILVTTYLCCPKCGKNLAELKETEVITLCTACQLAIIRPSS
ncbi:MAG: hypothetical protein ACFFC7_10565 [Candidatus Hermodarchaeota archaeon]